MADDLIGEVKKTIRFCNTSAICTGCKYDGVPDCRNKVMEKALSIIEAQQESLEALLPVLHGEWIDKTYRIGSCFATCSLCGESSSGYAKDTGFGYDYSFPNYCPHCGSKMDN